MNVVLTEVDQATPEWLTTVLRRDGRLPRGHVQSVAVRSVHDEQIHSISYFLVAGYSPDAPPEAPTRLFLKLPRFGAQAKTAAEQGEPEVRMYQALAAGQGTLPIIPCYDAVYDPDRPAYHLLLADLSATHDQPTSHLTIADRYITRTVDALAAFHAYWWEHPRLDNDLGALPTGEELNQEIVHLQASYVEFSRLLGEQLSAEDRHAYELLLRTLPTLWKRRTERAGQTMVHGDAHFWNFLYPLDAQRHPTYILDWQSYHVNRGTRDLAYVIVLRYPDRTPENERGLVGRYYAGLLRHGVKNYTWETCLRDYRYMAAEQLLHPMRWWLGDLPAEFWGMFVGRALAGFRDLDCAELLDQLYAER